MTPNIESSLTLDGVAHSWDGSEFLFSGLTQTLHRSESWALTGPSGSGKSTLLSILAGWERPTLGEIQRRDLRRVHWVFQNPHGQPQRTALDHVAYPLLARGSSRRPAGAEALEILDMFRLGGRAGALFGELSGGESQRLMLARAVAAKPDLLLVDEPTAQLDRASASAVNAVLGNLAASGALVVVASHDQDTIAACDFRMDLASSASITSEVPGLGRQQSRVRPGGTSPAAQREEGSWRCALRCWRRCFWRLTPCP
ncbi:ATP-binding cassette domain-containing protein [Microbacterium foliorum]|nr:ATP-binding cassette domain-containing protein [Microbacterium foliorum]AXL13700.1 ATP-binding cassette domain-containing protein [Microbacterium foliorum]